MKMVTFVNKQRKDLRNTQNKVQNQEDVEELSQSKVYFETEWPTFVDMVKLW